MIVGYITKGEGVIVHKKDCPNIQTAERIIDVAWNMDSDISYDTNLVIRVLDKKNRLLDIVTKASFRDVYLDGISTETDGLETVYKVIVKTKNLESLNNFINDIKSFPFVTEVTRRGD